MVQKCWTENKWCAKISECGRMHGRQSEAIATFEEVNTPHSSPQQLLNSPQSGSVVSHLCFFAASRRLQGNDPCAACEQAEPCYSIACVDGKMSTEGPFADCAKAKGGCDSCFPDSACGSLPRGSTRSPTSAPTPESKSSVPSWGQCFHASLVSS